MDRESMLLTNAKLSEAGVSIYFAPADFLEPGYWVDYAELDGIMLAHLSRGANRMLYELGKRALDMCASAIMLLFFAVLAPVIALLVTSTSAGPVFFRQQRVGKAGRRFTIYKFRTMYIHHVLHDEGGSIERASRRLGIPRSSLYNKMKRFEIPQGTGRL